MFRDLNNLFDCLKTAENQTEIAQITFLAFRMANTSLFRAFVGFINLFSSQASRINFFDQDRVKAWQLLEEKKLLTGEQVQANFNVVSKHENPIDVAKALVLLHDKGLLIDDAQAKADRDVLSTNISPINVAAILIMLHNKRLLTNDDQGQANRAAIKGHGDTRALCFILDMLKAKDLIQQSNFNAVSQRNLPIRAVIEVLKILKDNQRLNQANFDTVIQQMPYRDHGEVIKKLLNLSDHGILAGAHGQTQFDEVMNPSITIPFLVSIYDYFLPVFIRRLKDMIIIGNNCVAEVRGAFFHADIYNRINKVDSTIWENKKFQDEQKTSHAGSLSFFYNPEHNVSERTEGMLQNRSLNMG